MSDRNTEAWLDVLRDLVDQILREDVTPDAIRSMVEYAIENFEPDEEDEDDDDSANT